MDKRKLCRFVGKEYKDSKRQMLVYSRYYNDARASEKIVWGHLCDVWHAKMSQWRFLAKLIQQGTFS